MKPLVTFIIFSYCNEKYIKSAIHSALEQTYENLEIIISDDHSDDKSFEIIENISLNYNGPHKLHINRNERNLGLPGNFNRAHSIAKGSIIVVAGGDDISHPDRVYNTVKAFNKYPNAKVVTGKNYLIDAYGKLLYNQNFHDDEIEFSLNDFLKKNLPPVNAATRGYKSEIFKTFGNLDENGNTEDSPSLLRSLYMGTGVYIPEFFISYRKHLASLSASNNLNGTYQILNRQYKSDLNIAKKLNLINLEVDDLNDWFNFRFKKDALRNKYLKSKKNINSFLKYILLSRFFSIREKLDFLKKIIKTKL